MNVVVFEKETITPLFLISTTDPFWANTDPTLIVASILIPKIILVKRNCFYFIFAFFQISK